MAKKPKKMHKIGHISVFNFYPIAMVDRNHKFESDRNRYWSSKIRPEPEPFFKSGRNRNRANPAGNGTGILNANLLNLVSTRLELNLDACCSECGIYAKTYYIWQCRWINWHRNWHFNRRIWQWGLNGLSINNNSSYN